MFYQLKKLFCELWCLLQFGKCSEPDWQKQRLAVFLTERLAGIITALCIYWPAPFTARANFRYVEWQRLWALAKGQWCTFLDVLVKWKRTAQQMVWLEACLAGTIKTTIWDLSLLECFRFWPEIYIHLHQHPNSDCWIVFRQVVVARGQEWCTEMDRWVWQPGRGSSATGFTGGTELYFLLRQGQAPSELVKNLFTATKASAV